MTTSHSEPIYKDKRGKYRWRILGDNHKIVGASSQGFSSRDNAQDNLDLLFDLLADHVRF